jgi:hypothetical protein
LDHRGDFLVEGVAEARIMHPSGRDAQGPAARLAERQERIPLDRTGRAASLDTPLDTLFGDWAK